MTIYVDNVAIIDEDVYAEMQYQTNVHSLQEACFCAARSLVIRQLLLAKAIDKLEIANDKNITAKQEEEMIDTLINTEVAIPEMDDNACKNYYKNNIQKFKDKQADKVLPFEQVSGHIKEYLSSQSLMTGISEFIQSLAAYADIKGFDFKDPEATMVDLSGMTVSEN